MTDRLKDSSCGNAKTFIFTKSMQHEPDLSARHVCTFVSVKSTVHLTTVHFTGLLVRVFRFSMTRTESHMVLITADEQKQMCSSVNDLR